MSSPTRSVLGGGYHGSSPNGTNIMDFVTIATTGNAADFGDTTSARAYSSGVSSPTRAVNMGGYVIPATATNIIDYIEIATTGDAVDFGDIDSGTAQSAGGVSNGHGGL